MSQPDQQARTARDRAFEHALAARVKGTDWCFAYGTVSKNAAGWYVANVPDLSHRTGLSVSQSYKPMAADRLFWEMVGLSVDRKDTLSFRNRRLWTLKAPQHTAHIGEGVTDLNELADLLITWTRNWIAMNAHRLTIEGMLEQLGPAQHLSDDERILAICLSVLARDYQKAHHFATSPVAHEISLASGTCFIISEEGQSCTLIDKARAWLIAERRKGLKLAAR